MKEFLEILNGYYYVIVLCISIVLLIIQICTKKRTQQYNELVDFERIFNLVNEAESLFPDKNQGTLKLAYVLSKCSNLDPERVSKIVEEILSSPQKK